MHGFFKQFFKRTRSIVRSELLANEKWPSLIFVPVFFISTFVVLFYFNFLYYIQDEFRDP